MTVTLHTVALWRTVVCLVMAMVFGACNSSDSGETISHATLFVESQSTSHTVAGYSNSVAVQIAGRAGDAYAIEIADGGDWCWTNRTSHSTTRRGTLATSCDPKYIYVGENKSVERTATITVTVGMAEPLVLTLTQEIYDVPASYDHKWAELPAYKDDGSKYYATCYAPLSSSQTVRNFTVCFDAEKRIADWVAYPLHSCYRSGKYDRSNAWAYDPKIPADKQARIDSRSYSGGGVRGHQCMSYHRYTSYSTELNDQTFYSTNIFPQEYSFNSGVWGDMEDVCTKNICNDTLYLVTGTHGHRSWSRDNDGRNVSMPEYAYKVLLRTRSGRTGKSIDQITSASDLQAIGFWAANASSSKGAVKEFLVPVAEIEQKTGYKFFPMLREDIADQVKAQNKPSDWGIY